MAREMHPKGIHVIWVNIDGAVMNKHINNQNKEEEDLWNEAKTIREEMIK